MSTIQGLRKSIEVMEGQLGLPELPIMSWMCAVEGFSLSWVPLYSKTSNNKPFKKPDNL